MHAQHMNHDVAATSQLDHSRSISWPSPSGAIGRGGWRRLLEGQTSTAQSDGYPRIICLLSHPHHKKPNRLCAHRRVLTTKSTPIRRAKTASFIGRREQGLHRIMLLATSKRCVGCSRPLILQRSFHRNLPDHAGSQATVGSNDHLCPSNESRQYHGWA